MTEYQIGDEVAPTPTPKKTPIAPKKQDRTTIALLFIAAFVAVGGIGFALGHLTAPSATAAANPTGGARGGFGRALPSLAPGQTFDTSQFGGGAGGRGGLTAVTGGVSGTVQSVSAGSITVQLANGTTETIDISGTTTYHSAAAASSTDVKVGTSVTVQIDTAALASQAPNPSASGPLGGRTLTAKDVLITQP
jgi:preprotein translocase subunit YajC